MTGIVGYVDHLEETMMAMMSIGCDCAGCAAERRAIDARRGATARSTAALHALRRAYLAGEAVTGLEYGAALWVLRAREEVQ